MKILQAINNISKKVVLGSIRHSVLQPTNPTPSRGLSIFPTWWRARHLFGFESWEHLQVLSVVY